MEYGPQQQNNNGLLLAFIGVLVVAALIIWGLKSAREAPVLNPDGTGAPAVEWPSKEVKRESITQRTRSYEINAEYPVTARVDITDKLQAFVQEQIDSFKEDVAEFPEGSPVASMDITYEETLTSRADNYVFHIYTDTGGAHGIEITRSFVFDRTGDRITLTDLFTNDTRGLQLVSEYAKQELLKREFADSVWISDGAAPSQENFQTFVVTDAGLTFLFDPYQVAAYAAGAQEVSVPLSAFKTYANPDVFQ